MNIEARIMEMMNAAHRKFGMFDSSRIINDDCVWLKFKFKSHSDINRFYQYICIGRMGKLINLKDNFMIDVMV